MADALHDATDLENTRLRKQAEITSWNERDEFYGPNHPLKTKYREMNSDATKLFLKMRTDAHFFDQYSSKTAVSDRDQKFQEQLVHLYKRSRRHTSVSPELITHIQQANLALKKDHVKSMQKLSRKQQQAIKEYSIYLE